ncbi:hypothetical protein Gpo141_00000223 [Globisporangium polare]
MAALSTGMQHLDSLSLGVFSYLLAHKRVSHLEPKEMIGASHVQLAIWEQIWFRDLNGRWSFLAETFANYYRMMITHLGIVSWQPWLYLFIPQRMALDESEQ